MNEPKMSKEVENIKKAIEAYNKKHDNNTQILVSIFAFEGDDEEIKIVDSYVAAFGTRDILLEDITTITKDIEKEKDDFINW